MSVQTIYTLDEGEDEGHYFCLLHLDYQLDRARKVIQGTEQDIFCEVCWAEGVYE
jgi:hypothetical protein